MLRAGAIANGVANFVGNYPWWLTFNALNEALPTPAGGVLLPRLLRSACLGFASACVSDVVSNSVRVVKTIPQTSDSATSWAAAVRQVVAADGVAGLLGRGLATRLRSRASLQAMSSPWIGRRSSAARAPTSATADPHRALPHTGRARVCSRPYFQD